MARPIILRALVAALIALGIAVPAAAAPPVAAATPAQARAAMLYPLEIIKKRDLDFGYLAAPTAAGTAVIDPETDTISSTGGVLLLGGTPHAAIFSGAAKSSNVVIIRIPKQPATLTRIGGTETMTVSNWVLEGLDKRQAAAKVAFDFRVGGTLNVNANQAEGTYVGTFEVSIQYP
jgi:hypothetical protein